MKYINLFTFIIIDFLFLLENINFAEGGKANFGQSRTKTRNVVQAVLGQPAASVHNDDYRKGTVTLGHTEIAKLKRMGTVRYATVGRRNGKLQNILCR